MAGRILQQGDIVSLVEKAQGAFDEDEAKQDGEEGPQGRDGPRGLPHRDEADREARTARRAAQDAARREQQDAQAGEGRRPEAHEARRGDRALDDEGGAQEARADERLAPRARRQGQRPPDQRGEPPARAVPRDAEDDEEGRRRRRARWRRRCACLRECSAACARRSSSRTPSAQIPVLASSLSRLPILRCCSRSTWVRSGNAGCREEPSAARNAFRRITNGRQDSSSPRWPEEGPHVSHRRRRLQEPARRQVHRDRRPVSAAHGRPGRSTSTRTRVNHWLERRRAADRHRPLAAPQGRRAEAASRDASRRASCRRRPFPLGESKPDEA